MSRRDVKTDRGMRMSIVECDRKGCGEAFRSASDPKIVEQQLVSAGWLLLEIEVPRTYAWERKVLCPAHRPSTVGKGMINGRYWRERSPQGRRDSQRGRVAD